DAKYYEPVIEGMSRAVNVPGGTGYRVRVPDVEMCGKTGTVQNPHGENHAVFFAFAPRENPKIAIAVFVENAGYGATWAGPMVTMLVQKYRKDTIGVPQDIHDRAVNAEFHPTPKETKVEEVNKNTSNNNSTNQSNPSKQLVAEPRRDLYVRHSQLRTGHQ